MAESARIYKAAEAGAESGLGLRAAEAAIHRDHGILGGEPVFKGARIPVHGIAAMLAAGADRAELLDGYPKLDARKLDLAMIWAAAHPRRGRPKRLGDCGLSLRSSKRVPLGPDPLAREAPLTSGVCEGPARG